MSTYRCVSRPSPVSFAGEKFLALRRSISNQRQRVEYGSKQLTRQIMSSIPSAVPCCLRQGSFLYASTTSLSREYHCHALQTQPDQSPETVDAPPGAHLWGTGDSGRPSRDPTGPTGGVSTPSIRGVRPVPVRSRQRPSQARPRTAGRRGESQTRAPMSRSVHKGRM